jgi:hypothetical protein
MALFKENRFKGIIYVATALILLTFWQLYAKLVFGMSLLTQIYTGVSIATAYGYSPIKVIRYLILVLSSWYYLFSSCPDEVMHNCNCSYQLFYAL